MLKTVTMCCFRILQALSEAAKVAFATFVLVLTNGEAHAFQDNVRAVDQSPNIVLLFVDDLGWNDVGYRNDRFETPHIDKLASESLDFQRAYIASPTCSPSRATLLTGKHPARLQLVRHIPTGAENGFDKFGRTDHEFHLREGDPVKFPSRNWLPLEHTTYAEALKELGYYSQFIGKWHLGHEPFYPVHQGFDAQFATTNFGHPRSYNAPFFKNTDVLADVTEGHLTDLLTDESVRFIAQYNRDQPFMLSLWYYGVHRPPIGRADLLKHFESRGYDRADAIYAAQVKAIDESVGRIREALVRRRIDKETIIVFLSDQGSWYQNLPLRGSKRVDTLCEGGTRVPFLFHWPGVTRANTRSDSPVQSTDLFPTLVEVSGGDPKAYKDLDGISLVPHIRDKKPLRRNAPLFGYRAYEDLYASVREGKWKLLAYRSGKVSLYDVVDDVSEQQDVADNYPSLVRQLTKKLIAWEKQLKVDAYSGVAGIEPATEFQHLFGAKLLLRKIEAVNPTMEQLDEFNRLSRAWKAEVTALRDEVGITDEIIKRRDKAYNSLAKSGISGDELWLKLQQEAGITDEQREVFRKLKSRSNKFKVDVKQLLTQEQLRNLPKGRAPKNE